MTWILPVVMYEGERWFFDERLRQLRNVENPGDFIDLGDFEMYYFKKIVKVGKPRKVS